MLPRRTPTEARRFPTAEASPIPTRAPTRPCKYTMLKLACNEANAALAAIALAIIFVPLGGLAALIICAYFGWFDVEFEPEIPLQPRSHK